MNSVTNTQIFRIQAVHTAEKLKLKDLRGRFTESPIEFSNYEMIIRYASDSYMFVYNYGSVVFFNVPDEMRDKELAVFNEYRMPPGQARATDVFLLEVQELAVADQGQSPQVAPQGAKVFFDRIVVPAFSYQIVKIACMLLAESTALEYYEVLIENLLEQTNRFSKQLQKQGRMLESGEQLIRFIGMCMDTKQSIISNLYIVDSPDETWENVELDKLHQELKTMLEIDTRYRALDYKIKIIQESIEVIVDLSKSRRETLLELVIILLIAFEIFLTLIKWH
ncbi:MAG: RMD1 family protein [Bdellovibrionota bacterium]|mgnify:CR=1 FL=1